MAVIYNDRMMISAAANRQRPWDYIDLMLAALIAEMTLAGADQGDIDRRVAGILSQARQRFPIKGMMLQ